MVPHEYIVHVFLVSSFSVRLAVKPTAHGGTLKLRTFFRLCLAVIIKQLPCIQLQPPSDNMRIPVH